MTTKTTAPTTAAEARRLADELATAEAHLATQQRAARRTAAMAEADTQLLEPQRDLGRIQDAASDALRQAISNPDVGITDLFDAWQTLRIASTNRAMHAHTAAVMYDLYDGTPVRTGFEDPRRINRVAKYDSAAEAWPSFEAILSHAVSTRAEAAAAVVRHEVEQTIEDAAKAAEKSVK